jgi:hypothetical protein
MSNSPNGAASEKRKPYCGVIRPIAEIDGLPPAHWAEIADIVALAAIEAGYEPRLVSEASYSGVILKSIVSNLYNDPIVICDVSGKNPNVMFELGLRLAFDKPTIIIKDDRTSYSFDTSPIKHLEYPRDLRYQKMVEFREKLKLAIRETASEAENNPAYSTFLRHFGEFKVARLEQKEVGPEAYMAEQLTEIRDMVLHLAAREDRNIRKTSAASIVQPEVDEETLVLSGADAKHAQEFTNWLNQKNLVKFAINGSDPGGDAYIIWAKQRGSDALPILFRKFKTARGLRDSLGISGKSGHT